MEAFFIVFIVCIVVAVIAVFFFAQGEKIDGQILLCSRKIKALDEINQKTKFNEVQSRFLLRRHYDNKSNYNRVEPQYLMTAEIRENIEKYTDIIRSIQENRRMRGEYLKEIDAINCTVTEAECEPLKISVDEFVRRENKLFNRRILQTIVDCEFKVVMTYSSPKGKVNLSKSSVFHLDEMFVCLESVSRTRLDRDTYKRLVAVERGMLNDGLRYDVMNRDKFRCVLCGASAEQGVRLHVDHIIPIAKGGKTEINNLRVLCERCNIGKSDKIETGMEMSKDAEKDNLKQDSDSLDITAITESSAKSEFQDVEPSEKKCPQCGGTLMERSGKYGAFFGCSNYPKCKYSEKR